MGEGKETKYWTTIVTISLECKICNEILIEQTFGEPEGKEKSARLAGFDIKADEIGDKHESATGHKNIYKKAAPTIEFNLDGLMEKTRRSREQLAQDLREMGMP